MKNTRYADTAHLLSSSHRFAPGRICPLQSKFGDHDQLRQGGVAHCEHATTRRTTLILPGDRARRSAANERSWAFSQMRERGQAQSLSNCIFVAHTFLAAFCRMVIICCAENHGHGATLGHFCDAFLRQAHPAHLAGPFPPSALIGFTLHRRRKCTENFSTCYLKIASPATGWPFSDKDADWPRRPGSPGQKDALLKRSDWPAISPLLTMLLFAN